jgi:DivIVA domain-containing protein
LDRKVLVRSDLVNVQFRSKLRGYHPADVDAFIERLVNEIL